MLLYSVLLITGLLNIYLLLFQSGWSSLPLPIALLAILGALLLFTTSGLALFRKTISAWIGLIFIAPILLYQITVLWQVRGALGGFTLPVLSILFLCDLGVITLSFKVLAKRHLLVERQGWVNRLLRVVLALLPPGLIIAYVFEQISK